MDSTLKGNEGETLSPDTTASKTVLANPSNTNVTVPLKTVPAPPITTATTIRPQASNLSEETTLRIKRQILASQVASAQNAAPLPPNILQAAKLPRPGGLTTGVGSDTLAELLCWHQENPHPLGDAKVSEFYRRTVPGMTVGGLLGSGGGVGLDLELIKRESERLMETRAEFRILQLEKELDSITMDTPSRNRLLIELKMLKLRHVQREWREKMLRFVHELKSVDNFVDRTAVGVRKGRKQTLRESRIPLGMTTQAEERAQRRERLQKEREANEFIKAVLAHHRDLATTWRMVTQRRARLVKQIMHLHNNFEKEENKRSERIMKERMRALKNDDEAAYYKLLDQEKDVRLTFLLRQTDEFLCNLAQKVRAHQDMTSQRFQIELLHDERASPKPFQSESKEEATLTESLNDFYNSIHRTLVNINHQPKLLQGGQLKEYQMKGLQWMISLYENRLNGILADEMGLGKTIQTIALIVYLMETVGLTGPFLIIVPLSTMTNWSMEFEKWAPSVNRIEYKGLPQQRKTLQHQIKHGQFNVLLTTYEYVIKDKPALSKVKWLYLIVDEGHRMKNAHSKLATVLSQHYSMRYRLILTGTPLQNNLPELWSLLNFLLPDVFNSCRTFEEWFNAPFANTGEKMELNEEELLLVIRRLHKVLHPFLLRRMKRDVEAELPEKLEVILKCPMSALQSSLYRAVTSRNSMAALGSSKDSRNFGIRRLNNTIMQLRKICNHPFVFEEVEQQVNPRHINNELLYRVAGKFELLQRILPKFAATGHKILMFFQMTQIMTIMEDFLNMQRFKYLRLDGSTKAEDRTELLRLFNAPNSPYFIFLLSTRAGGLGLNLQTADTVIIFDSDWNPHQDLQAQDRAHRIGQTKEVRIFRLITVESVEEYILKRAQHKLSLDGKIIQAGKFDQRSTNEERDEMLRAILEREAENDEVADIYDDEELNEIISRNDNELEQFKQLDEERARQETELHERTGVKKARLIEANELPKVYLSISKEETENAVGEETAFVDEDTISEEGSILGVRAARRREVSYNERMSDDKWLKMQIDSENVKVGDIANEAVLKRGRKKKVTLNASEDGSGGDESGTLSTMTDSGEATPIKRGRKADQSLPKLKFKIPKLNVATPSTYTIAASHSTEATTNTSSALWHHESDLSPDIKLNIIRKVFSLVENCTEPETGRYRSDLFLELPSPEDYPDYYKLIKQPISLAEIEPQLEQYKGIGEFMADLNRMFANAMTYNMEGSQVYDDAQVMKQLAQDKIQELLEAEGEFDDEMDDDDGDEVDDEEENDDDDDDDDLEQIETDKD